MSKNLWPTEIEEIKVDNTTYDILKEQAEFISKQTDGKVKCIFEKIKYNTPDMSNFGKIISQVSVKSIGSEVVDDGFSEKTNVKDYINPNKGKYKFELYNDTYRYRLFTYSYSIYFPNILELDDGICEELKMHQSVEINSNEELETYLKKVFASINVRTALQKMIQ